MKPGIIIAYRILNSGFSEAPKKAKGLYWTNKVMDTVFWDLHGIIDVDYLENGQRLLDSIMST